MKIHYWAVSDVGRKREHNEDSYLCAPDLGLWAVADGMGGHLGGARASNLAVEVLGREVRAARERGEDPPEFLPAAFRQAGATIHEAAQRDHRLRGMGTTLTAFGLHNGRAHIVHVGDSRVYLVRDGRARQLTDDHSWVAEQVRAGLITEEQAQSSRLKHIITRSVGFEPDVSADRLSLAVQTGDCYLVCSDGLSNYFEAAEIGRLVTTQFYRRVPALLAELANERGGDDNITGILLYAANEA